jgi:hypothetical protein
LFHVILHIGNKDSVETYLNLMKHIKVWIEDIFELDNFEPTWKSENIYSLPNQVFIFKPFYYMSIFDFEILKNILKQHNRKII